MQAQLGPRSTGAPVGVSCRRRSKMLVQACASRFSHVSAPSSASASGEALLSLAVRHSKAGAFDEARHFYAQYMAENPHACRTWVSWAQMEKRTSEGPESIRRAREVLQTGLEANPTSACLIQAWGLMELRRGNLLAAIMMLERAVKIEPNYEPVLRWQQVNAAREVVTARKTVGSRRSRQSDCTSCTSS